MLSLLPSLAVRSIAPAALGGLHGSLRYWWMKPPGRPGSSVLSDLCGINPMVMNNMTSDDWVLGLRNGNKPQALTFDGSNDYVEVQRSIQPRNDLTAMVVCRYTAADISNDTCVFSLGNSATTAGVQLRIGNNTSGSHLKTAVFNSSGGGATEAYTTSPPGAGNWCVLWLGLTSGNAPKIAVNTLGWQADGTAPTGTLDWSGAVIGARWSSGSLGRYFGGDVQEVRLFHGVLSNQHQAELYYDMVMGYPRTLRRQSTYALGNWAEVAAPPATTKPRSLLTLGVGC